MNGKLTSSFATSVAADFDGNGWSDIAFGSGGTWRVSLNGRRALTTLREGSAAPPLNELFIGRFYDRIPRDQVVGFDSAGRNLDIWRNSPTRTASPGSLRNRCDDRARRDRFVTCNPGQHRN